VVSLSVKVNRTKERLKICANRSYTSENACETSDSVTLSDYHLRFTDFLLTDLRRTKAV